jgi:DNA-binding transcriptional LysR family regulator
MRIRIDLRQLECFVAVAEEGTFRAAAERLHMSQPPLSRQIKQLESELGVTLLNRDPAGAELTTAGSAFLKEASKTLLQAAKAMETARRHAKGTPRQLRVGYTKVFDPEVFPSVEPAFKKAVPGGSLVFVAAISVELIRRLRRGALDLALIGLPSATGELVIEPLHKEPLVAVIPAGHPLARHKVLSIAQLNDQPLFWPQRRTNPGFFDYYEEVFARLGHAPSRRLTEPEDHHLLLAEVANGRGIGFIPKSMTKVRRAGAIFRPLKEREFWIGFGLAYRNAQRASELDALLRIVRSKTALLPPGME